MARQVLRAGQLAPRDRRVAAAVDRRPRAQIENLEQAFAALGAEADDKPCPTIEALDKESGANVRIAHERMKDAVILSGAAETEHHEIAVYEALIAHAEAKGEQEVVGRLRENLQQEQHTPEEVTRAMQTSVREFANAPA